MIGRGLIGDPGMLTPGGTTAAALEAFFSELLEVYTRDFGGVYGGIGGAIGMTIGDLQNPAIRNLNEDRS